MKNLIIFILFCSSNAYSFCWTEINGWTFSGVDPVIYYIPYDIYNANWKDIKEFEKEINADFVSFGPIANADCFPDNGYNEICKLSLTEYKRRYKDYNSNIANGVNNYRQWTFILINYIDESDIILIYSGEFSKKYLRSYTFLKLLLHELLHNVLKHNNTEGNLMNPYTQHRGWDLTEDQISQIQCKFKEAK